MLQQCNGYRALKALLHESHPAFYDQPATLITAYPKQDNSSLLEHHDLFLDHLQLRAFITNQVGSLNDAAQDMDTMLKVLRSSPHGADFGRFYNVQGRSVPCDGLLGGRTGVNETPILSDRKPAPNVASRNMGPAQQLFGLFDMAGVNGVPNVVAQPNVQPNNGACH